MGNPMNRDRIRELIQILKSSAAQELSVRDGERMVRIRRRAGEGGTGQAQPSVAEAVEGEAGAQGPAEVTVPVQAALVGLFYRGREAGAEPLVELGDQVEEGQVVGTIDTLRRLTDVVSPRAGEIIQMLADDGQPVQYGEVLMRLKPSEGEGL